MQSGKRKSVNAKSRARLIAKLFAMTLLAFSIVVMGCTHCPPLKEKPISPIVEWYAIGDSVCVSEDDAQSLAIYLLELESNP